MTASVLQDVTCNAGQTCEPVLVPGCDGVQCQKYTAQCTGFDQFCFCSNCSGLALIGISVQISSNRSIMQSMQ